MEYVRAGGVTGRGAFGADGRGGGRFGAGGAAIPAAGGVLGADYNLGHYAVIVGCGVRSFLAAHRRNGAWSGSRRDCSESIRAASACIRNWRVHTRTDLRRDALRPKCISVRGSYAGDCAVGAADRSRMADRLSSVCRSVHRNWSGAGVGGGVAGEGTYAIGQNVTFPCISSETSGKCLGLDKDADTPPRLAVTRAWQPVPARHPEWCNRGRASAACGG